MIAAGDALLQYVPYMPLPGDFSHLHTAATSSLAHRRRSTLATARWLAGFAAWSCLLPLSVEAKPLRDADSAAATAANEEDKEIRVQLVYLPVPSAQIAIWLENSDGSFVRDILVTQATGKLGIGNRPGIWNFLSSWRAPYGPRPSVLPIWAHRRNVTYPKIIFHDDRVTDSLGYHESFSSREPYHCRPLTPPENDAIIDTLTCPSPQTFKTDKGRFDPSGATVVYPPRADVSEFDSSRDHVDIKMYGELNDLDSVTKATPTGETPEVVNLVIKRSELNSDEVAIWLEISLENDQNEAFTYDRESDHFVDPRLETYGVGYLGQPSVAFRTNVNFAKPASAVTSSYEGYGDWNGKTGKLHPPDDKISKTNGSGEDRLQKTKFGDLEGRLIAYVAPADDTGEDPCVERKLEPVEELTVESLSFDRAKVSFKIPDSLAQGVEITRLRAFQKVTYKPGDFGLGHAIEINTVPKICTDASASDCVVATPGESISFEVAELFGDHSYDFTVLYEDSCGNASDAAPEFALTTPSQTFQQLESFCVVATASYGAPWVKEVAALRLFRDAILRPDPIGNEFVRYYYAYGPSVVPLVGASEATRAATRDVLRPLADLAIKWLWSPPSDGK